MKLITTEEHFTDKRVMDAAAQFDYLLPKMSPKQAEQMKFLMSRAFLGDQLFDFEKMRIPFMDKHNVQMQVLSYTAPVGDHIPAADAIRICRMANDILKQRIDQYPGRFAGFAALPMADPVAAADELERCVVEYGFCGTMLAGRFRGRFFNEAEFFPVFERAAKLDVPIYFHPAFIPQNVLDTYYMSDAYSFVVAAEFGSAAYGWHSEVGIQISRMILSGIFDKLPNLKFLSGHWGETIPAFLERMDYMLPRDITGLNKNFSEYYKKHVYITPSGIMSRDQLEYIVHVMGADHVIYSLDYPYIQPDNAYEFLADAPLTDEQKEQIAHINAERILHIK